ncbi:MAG: carboxypeptidase-like regulatory domain-containing protein [Acidobacteriota bacterium]
MADGEVELKPPPLTLTPHRGQAVPEGLVARRWIDGKALAVSFSLAPDTPAPRLVLHEACGEDSLVVLEAPGLVSTPVEVIAGSRCAGAVREVGFLPAARLSGRLVMPEGHEMATWGWLEVAPCAVPEASRVLQYPFAVEHDGPFHVGVPAGCVRAVVVAQGMAPAPLPELKLAPGALRQLGAIRLRPGATITTRVVFAEDGRPVPGAIVRPVPAARLEEAVCAVTRGLIDGFPRGVRTTERGWVSLTGLAPGEYSLLVEAEGCAPALGASNSVTKGETTIADLEIGRPGRLQVTTTPIDELLRQGMVLMASAVPTLDGRQFFRCERTAAAGRDGSLEIAGLPPGRWAVDVALDLEGLRQPVASSEVEVPSGGTATFTADLSAKLVHGRIEYRRQPVIGRFTLFRQAEALASPAYAGATDDEGRFVAIVAGAGRYWVLIDADRPPLFVTVPELKLPLDGEEVVIRLPGGSIPGSVVDAGGRAVAGARVLAEQHGVSRAADGEASWLPLSASAKTDGSGAFALEALAPGSWQLRAQADDEQSAPAVVRLAEGGSQGGVVLVLGKGRRLAGHLFSATGVPVAGATIVACLPPAVAGGLVEAPQTRTDDSGRFEIELPPAAPSLANLEIAVGGQPLTALLVKAADDLVLRLPAAGGSLQLRPRAGVWAGQQLAQLCLIAPDGAFLTLGYALVFPGVVLDPRAGGALHLPLLAPGEWRVIRGQPGRDPPDVLFTAARDLPAVATFDITPGQATDVEIDLRGASPHP